MSNSTCGSCGGAVAPENSFCPSCGVSLQEAATLPAAATLDRLTTDRLTEATTGEFEVLQRIGHGAMGSVYLARDVALSRRVAIKVISPQLLQDESMVARFRLEARTVAALRHPNIVNLHAVRELGDLHFFIMDYIDGTSLRSVLKAHAPLDIPVAQALLFQVGSALAYAHRRGSGVIHRDVKPANVMVDREGNAVVMDFGISKVGAAQSGLTQTGATIGTPEYMSPEQCMDRELTGASDQYALGIVAYEMLTGSVPYKGSTYAIMMAHAQGTPPSIRERRPDCPEEVGAAVMRMLAKEPSDRFGDVEEAVAALGGAPLGHRDPVRDALVVLVESVSDDESSLDESSPLSPIPSRRDVDAAFPAAPSRAPQPLTQAESVRPELTAPQPPVPSTAARPASAAETVLAPRTGTLPSAEPPTASAADDDGKPAPTRRRWIAVAALVVVALGLSAVALDRFGTNSAGEPTSSLASAQDGAAAEPGDAARAEPTPMASRPPAAGAGAPAAPAASAPIAAAVRLSGGRDALREGASAPISATPVSEAGEPVDVDVTWTSSDRAVATVDGGALLAHAPGVATITAAAPGGASARTDVAVLGLPTREDVQRVLRQFVEPMLRQNTSEVQRRFGRTARGQRQSEILESIRQSSFSAQLTDLDEAVADGAGALVEFEVTMRWRGVNGQRMERPVWFRSTLTPSPEGWQVDEVTPLSR